MDQIRVRLFVWQEPAAYQGVKLVGENNISSEVIMTKLNTYTVAAALLVAIAGCGKQSDVPKPVTDNPGTSSTSSTSGPSVAASPSAMPPSDAAIKPAPPPAAPKTSDAEGPTQATPKELSKNQESGTMPLAGQANNHSTPATTSEKK